MSEINEMEEYLNFAFALSIYEYFRSCLFDVINLPPQKLLQCCDLITRFVA